MGNSAKKKICTLFLLFAILFFAGCSNTTSDSIALTITEQMTTRHVEQPSTITTQEIRLGDIITLESEPFGIEGVVTIKEVRDNFVIVQFDGFPKFGSSNVAYDQIEIEYGKEYLLGPWTLSSGVRWTLVFER